MLKARRDPVHYLYQIQYFITYQEGTTTKSNESIFKRQNKSRFISSHNK
jgi:hypothetical protein